MAATLAHELAHAVTHVACTGAVRDPREVMAEAVPYAVGSHIGLDMALRSAHYVAAWLEYGETFRATMARIYDCAAVLVDALEKKSSLRSVRCSPASCYRSSMKTFLPFMRMPRPAPPYRPEITLSWSTPLGLQS